MFTFLKKYSVALFIILIFVFIVVLQYKNTTNLMGELSEARSNEKAYIFENTKLKEDCIVFKYTIDQLNYLTDSLTEKMNEVRKELGIKDRDIKRMEYLLSKAQKTDTIKLLDTIFIDRNLNIDTLIGDEWYTMRLGLQYPNLVTTTPTFVSEKYIVVNSKKETINPPKRCLISRWFQRKHTIIEVNVLENNPYIVNEQQRFIEIIK